ncbi:MAG: hypothetical protein ACR2LG_09890 [Actinomycetota bacterium]
MRHRVQRIALLSVVALSTQMLWAGAAEAKEFRLPEASIVAKVRSDGAIAVTERLTHSFDGGFSGAYREIPLTGGVEVGDVSVSEADQTYRPGAPTELGSSGFPGTFGVADFGSMNEAPPGSNRYLGAVPLLRDRLRDGGSLLAAAQLKAPPELQNQSSIYWVGPHGPLGSGASGFAISDISNAVGSAGSWAASASGGGAGFSGGGGGGGGGGGAW